MVLGIVVHRADGLKVLLMCCTFGLANALLSYKSSYCSWFFSFFLRSAREPLMPSKQSSLHFEGNIYYDAVDTQVGISLGNTTTLTHHAEFS